MSRSTEQCQKKTINITFNWCNLSTNKSMLMWETDVKIFKFFNESVCVAWYSSEYSLSKLSCCITCITGTAEYHREASRELYLWCLDFCNRMQAASVQSNWGSSSSSQIALHRSGTSHQTDTPMAILSSRISVSLHINYIWRIFFILM